jgi:hypothetical protein
MAKDKEIEEPLKELVKKIVASIVRRLVKASAKKTVAELRKRLEDEAVSKVEDKLKEAAPEELEKKLSQSGQRLQEEIVRDNPQGKDYLNQLKQGLEQDFDKFFSSFKGLSRLAITIISCVCTLVAGAVIGGVIVYNIVDSQPQPDLVITDITFQMELLDIPPDFPYEESNPYYQVIIHYTIENQGDAGAGQSTSYLYLGGDKVAQDTVGYLGAGESAESAFYDYPVSGADFYLYFCSPCTNIDIAVCADCCCEVDESHEANNCFALSFTLP